MTTNGHPGPLALIGGAEWHEKCTFDADLLAASGGRDVLVLPTAAAYEHPERAVASAERYFEGLGGQARGLMVVGRADAEDGANAAIVAASRFIYLGGGSPLHLRSVLKDSRVWQALEEAWRSGAVVAGSSAGAMALCDPMIDPRGGALTLGLGLIEQVAVLPHANTWSPEKAHRTFSLATKGLRIAAIDEQTALIRDPDGTWRAEGAGEVVIYVDGTATSLDALTV
jgi:cyanophycinase